MFISIREINPQKIILTVAFSVRLFSNVKIIAIVNVRNCSFKMGCVNVSGKKTLSTDSELTFTLEIINFKSVMCEKCIHNYINSNSLCASVHTLSPISTQGSSQTVN